MSDVVDTNVPLVVRFPEQHARVLADACETLLDEIITEGRAVVTDEGGEIIEEYFHQLSHSGAPTLGDTFAKWVFDHRWAWDPATRPDIDPRGPNDYGVLDGDDADFDPSDRKFIAVAKVAGVPIHQATDTKWLDWGHALDRHGVEVRFVHEATIRGAYRMKFGRDPL